MEDLFTLLKSIFIVGIASAFITMMYFIGIMLAPILIASFAVLAVYFAIREEE